MMLSVLYVPQMFSFLETVRLQDGNAAGKLFELLALAARSSFGLVPTKALGLVFHLGFQQARLLAVSSYQLAYKIIVAACIEIRKLHKVFLEM